MTAKGMKWLLGQMVTKGDQSNMSKLDVRSMEITFYQSMYSDQLNIKAKWMSIEIIVRVKEIKINVMENGII